MRLFFLYIITIATAGHLSTASCLAQTSSKSGVAVVMSNNVELMGLLVSLTGQGESPPGEFPLADEARARFRPFQDHPAVAGTQVLMDAGWGWVDFCRLALSFSEFPEARPLTDPSDPNMARFLTPDILRYASDIRDFHSQSDFGIFCEEHRPVYDTIRAAVQDMIDDVRIAYYLKLVYGTALGRYYVVPSALMPNRSYHVERIMDGSVEAFCVFGPSEKDTGQYYFIPKQRLIADIIFHEFSYSFLEPILQKHESLISQYSRLHSIVQSRTAGEKHDTWRRLFTENLIMAMEARLAGKIYGRALYLEKLNRAAQSGLIMAPAIADIVDTYCTNRDRYPVFEDYLPCLMAALGDRYADSLKTAGGQR